MFWERALGSLWLSVVSAEPSGWKGVARGVGKAWKGVENEDRLIPGGFLRGPPGAA